jgi:phosphoglycerate dehydrogenase-like enzyme
MTGPRVLILPPPSLYQVLFSRETEERLSRFARVTRNEKDKNLSSQELAQIIESFDGAVTSWGSPAFTEEVVAKASRLKVIAHAAGSVKRYISEAVVERGIVVTSAAVAIAVPVAEHCLGLILASLRKTVAHNNLFKEKGVWGKRGLRAKSGSIHGKKIGVIGASFTGREFIKLLGPFDCQVLVYDPYLSEEDAQALGVKCASLQELLRESDIVALHAPLTSETQGMLGAGELALMKDDAVLVNTARGKIIDHTALLAELQKGRLCAGLDVTDPEPLPQDSPFRKLDNVIITPHIAGFTPVSRLAVGRMAAQSVIDVLSGRTPVNQVDLKKISIIA